MRSFVSVPLLAEGKVLGVLGLGSTFIRDFALQKSFIESLCAVTAIWIHNSRILDISKHQNAELEALYEQQLHDQLALAESEDRFKAVFNAVSDVMFVHDAQTLAIVEVNQRACDSYGYTRDELLYIDVGVLSSGLESYTAEHAGRLLRKARSGKPQRFEWQAKARDGRLFWLDMTLHKALLGGKERLLASGRAISDWKEAEKLLRQEKLFTDTVLDSVPGLLYVYDDDGLLVRWNKKHEELTGYSAAELSRMHLFDWYKDDPVALGKVQAALPRLARDGHATVEANLQKKDGTKSLYYLTAVSFVLDGKSFFTGIGIDITERKRMQEAMIQTEKMMSVGGLAAGMAHEINNPLSGILQNVQVLLRRLQQDSRVNNDAAGNSGCSFQAVTAFMKERGILDSLESIRESGARAAQVVKSMLEFSRPGVSYAPADINILLDNAVAMCATDYDLKKEYDFRNISIVREYASGLPGVQCSKSQIQQVLMNLFSNAAQAMAGMPSPKITLRTALDGDMVAVEVEDNGPGMDEATRRKIFEPFFTTKPVGEGTGLGLSVSYFIITNNHHGTIAVETEPGKGACFTIRLPLTRP